MQKLRRPITERLSWNDKANGFAICKQPANVDPKLCRYKQCCTLFVAGKCKLAHTSSASEMAEKMAKKPCKAGNEKCKYYKYGKCMFMHTVESST